jgi:hypothetical protein
MHLFATTTPEQALEMGRLAVIEETAPVSGGRAARGRGR